MTSGTNVAYLCRDFRLQDEQDAANVLASTLKQLILDRPERRSGVERLYEYHDQAYEQTQQYLVRKWSQFWSANTDGGMIITLTLIKMMLRKLVPARRP